MVGWFVMALVAEDRAKLLPGFVLITPILRKLVSQRYDDGIEKLEQLCETQDVVIQNDLSLVLHHESF